jgi:hypothetical protein
MASPPTTVTAPAVGGAVQAVWGAQVGGNENFLSSPPKCLLNQAAAQNLTTGTAATLTLTGVTFDTDSMSSVAGTITVQTPGYYLIHGSVGFASNATGYRNATILVSGANAFGRVGLAASPTTNNTVVPVTALTYIAALGTIQLQALQSSGGTLAVVTGLSYSWLSALWVSN